MPGKPTLLVGCLVLAGLLWAGWQRFGADGAHAPAAVPATTPGLSVRDMPPADTGAPASSGDASAARPTASERASPQALTDLRAIYERHRGSDTPGDRNMAHRAWSACFPAFIAPQGGAVSLESMTATLPRNDPVTPAREAAYREIWGRCSRFSDLSREQLLAETRRQADAMLTGAAASPGERAANAHQAGDSAGALRIARAVVDSQDPYAVESLQEFLKLYWWDYNDRNPARPVARPDLRAMAFSLAACDLGMDCGAASLTALQQCAFTGACTGSVADRLLQGLPNADDRTLLGAEAARVLAAIRARDYRALGLSPEN